jgi:predicted ATPase/DNA-binding SARP family transcriptional activator/DNA-binding CsgD family transcriptional regulator
LRSPAESRRLTRPDTLAGNTSEALRICLLGGFEVSVGSRSMDAGAWRLKKAAALVKLLALAPDHRLHKEQAMDLLWPDLGKKAAANNLRQVLHAARKTIDATAGSAYVTSVGESLALAPDGPLWVDVRAFEEAAARARGSDDPAVYRAALDLYAGDLLPGDRYEGWAESRRERLRQMYLALLVGLARTLEERGEYDPACDALRTAVAAEPTLEEAHAAMMRLLALSGRPEGALAQYERLRDALARSVGRKPTSATCDLRDRIAAGTFVPAPPAGAPQERSPGGEGHDLPAGRTRFIGRESELVAVKRELAMTRLLTLTGAGGSGKTRLALEAGRELYGAHRGGARLVELAPLSEPGLVTAEAASALGVTERPGQALAQTIVEALRDREILLILDNCEHIVEAAARLADLLLDGCPRIKILATSREPLGVPGEVLWRVPPLSLPDEDGGETVEGLIRYEAVRLFVDRSRLRLPGFSLTAENAPAVARVCRKLAGIPLAIELATARMGTLAVEQVAQRLEASLDVLSAGSRTAEPRQRTLRATLDWSYDLLAADERALFGRLSVFAGGWTLEAAEAVGAGKGIEPHEVLDLLGGLVDKSLVIAGPAPGGAVRYRMLEPVRQYARERLEKSGEAGETRDRHAALFLALVEEAAPELVGELQRDWVDRLEGEHDNLRSALAWTLRKGDGDSGLRLGAGLWRFWFAQGYLSEGRGWLRRAVLKGERVASHAKIQTLEGMGWLAQNSGDLEDAQAAYERMLELSRTLDDKGSIATALNSLGTIAGHRGNHARARALLEENLAVLEEMSEGGTDTILKRHHAINLLGLLALDEEGDAARARELWGESLALARRAGDTYRVGIMLTGLSYASVIEGDNDAVEAFGEEALSVAREIGSGGTAFVPEVLVNSSLAALSRGDLARSATLLIEALTLALDRGANPSVVNALEAMASLAACRDDATHAARLWGAAEAAREVSAIALPPGDRKLHEPHLATARSRLGDEAWAAALAEGHAMTLEEAAEYALSTAQDSSAVPNAHTGHEPTLSPREEEVAALVARGFTNRQISSRLAISERTAGNHVGRILRKLGLHSRTQIAAWVVESRRP